MMYGLIPEPKVYNRDESQTKLFQGFNFKIQSSDTKDEVSEIINMKMWNYTKIAICFDEQKEHNIDIVLVNNIQGIDSTVDKELFRKQGYELTIQDNKVHIAYLERDGFVNALSTLKQLLKPKDGKYYFENCSIVDWPSIERRSVSNTFAWYAGYGRIGFDMQLWGYDEWVEYLNICSDYKINQFNMCMYGYWPFEFPEHPETELRDYKMKIWNDESENWVEMEYLHPNLSNEFLPKLIEYGHKLGVDFFAYIGLNSYNGGYPSINKDKRMKLPEGGKFVNDFDSLCLSDESNVEYIGKAIQQVVRQGFDGIDFEESEESYWFCTCDACSERFLADRTPAEAKHHANYWLLNFLYKKIKEVNPNCIIGLRAWREPPLEKDPEYLEYVKSQIPNDVVLFWAPGLYVSDDEFPKWVRAFGKDRIYARDSEANSVSSTMGRLYRIFQSNVLRAEEETNHQYIENDIKQHIGSVEEKVKGINGYMFEWYGYFLHLQVHSYYGWGSYRDPDEFYDYAIHSTFGPELKGDILYVLQNMLTIHESQMKIFPTEFPFLRNKVEKRDIPTIQHAIDDWQNIMDKIQNILKVVSDDPKLEIYRKHFEKIENAHKRNRIIYDLSLASINYDNAETEEAKRKYLTEMAYHNERNFDLVKEMFFDVNPVSETGTKAC
ncbi:glycoside hydrolase family 20 zincin-like fold domain-containing protein, partial [Virgibacillus sp. W0430]|uniref:glycoside hydrolase family 20 zincin-like fold domain-containing protein n=1 Tax=Virgibacillus sp. W0430 TaxID=3391580 RepID=UPI003F4832DD